VGVEVRPVLAVLVFAGLVACDSVEGPTLATGQLPIESVDVVVLESIPYQLRAQVRGYLPDSCTRLHGVTQSRAGNVITVSITTLRDLDAFCLQRIETVERTIPLEGAYPPGEYVLRVNNMAHSFTL
jgi:hypothetical protein